ncbi:MAG: chromate transporter [Bradyrhizobium sp.]|nr:chromate transporter [Bradyrhizobium sp.]
MAGAGTEGASSPAAEVGPHPPQVGLVELFLLFSQLGLSSFGGGVSAWMHRAFVARRGWFGEAEFSAALALARIMPGVNVVNLAVLIGQRLRGAPGATAAALGLLVGPSLAAIGLTVAYDALAGSAVLHAAIEGAAAAAAGLLIAMGLSSAAHGAGATRQNNRSGAAAAGRSRFAPRWRNLGAIAVLLIVFVLIGLMRLPTVPVVLCVAPLSIALAYLAMRPDRGGEA